MKTLFWSLIAVVAVLGIAWLLWIVDRLLLRAEERGWIFYRRKKPSGGTISSGVSASMRELDRLITRPSVEHVIEAESKAVEDENEESK